MNTITTKMEMIDLLKSINGATIVGLTTLTDVRMKKGGNPLANEVVTKLVSKTCQFGYNYENAINNRIEKLGGGRDFKTESLKWGEWLIPNKVITHKGEFYGRFYTMKNAESTTIYFVNGKVANPKEVETIEEFAYEHTESRKQTENGLVENQVQPMNYKFTAIQSIRVGGVTYKVDFAESMVGVVA